MVYREETLLNVIRSVTRNGWSIVLTAALALILVYLFSIIGYMFFKNDFVVDVSDNDIDWGKMHWKQEKVFLREATYSLCSPISSIFYSSTSKLLTFYMCGL